MADDGRAFVALQSLLPKRALTALVYRLARSRWLAPALIRGFARLYHVDLSEASEPDLGRYPTFNAFFTRTLRAGARPLPSALRAIACPCDGSVSERGSIDGERLLQAELAAKRYSYTLEELLGADPRARDFIGGEFATIYLAPHNYHRVHMPIDGRLTGLAYIPGQLFSVNRTTANRVPRLFARNERVICRFDTAAGALAVVFVGAFNVASIGIEGFGDLTPARKRFERRFPVPAPTPMFLRGAELGRFNMGSTIIVLMQRGRCRWAGEFAPGAAVRMGAVIGEVLG
jgi:phosphatidylserine decarboxylase